MMSGASLWAILGTAVGSILAIAVDVALLIIALTVVRKNRPDTVGFFAGAAGIFLFATLASPLVTASTAFYGARGTGGVDQYVAISTLVGMAFAVFRTIAFVLLLIGIARLAQPSPNSQH